MIICCDGALKQFLRHRKAIFGNEDRLPEAVIGDMDSLPAAFRSAYKGRIVEVEEQENNDQTKAFHYVMSHCRGAKQIHIIGATGKREDHTVGNMSLLMEYARIYDLAAEETSIDMVTDYGTIFPITDTTEFECGKGRKISIFTPDNSLSIKSCGLEWPTDGVIFDNWWKATLNRSSEDKVRLELSHKSMALIVID